MKQHLHDVKARVCQGRLSQAMLTEALLRPSVETPKALEDLTSKNVMVLLTGPWPGKRKLIFVSTQTSSSGLK